MIKYTLLLISICKNEHLISICKNEHHEEMNEIHSVLSKMFKNKANFDYRPKIDHETKMDLEIWQPNLMDKIRPWNSPAKLSSQKWTMKFGSQIWTIKFSSYISQTMNLAPSEIDKRSRIYLQFFRLFHFHMWHHKRR